MKFHLQDPISFQVKNTSFFLIFQINPPPNSPKESEFVLFMSITYLGLVLIFPTKFHPDPSTLSIFQDFRFPPPMSPDPVGI